MLTENFMNHVFNGSTMTFAINKAANQYGLLDDINLAPIKGIGTTTALIKYKDGKVSVLPSRERGGPRTERKLSDEKSVYVEVPHFPNGGLITPMDIQNRYQFTDDNFIPATVDMELADHAADLRFDHDITLEYIRMGMLFGQIKDGEGNELANLHTDLGVPKTTINFQLGNATTDVNKKCREVRRHFRKNARGMMISGKPLLLVSTDFFDMLKVHPNVEKFYLNYQDARALRGGDNENDGPDYGEKFEFGNCIFQSYDAQVPLADDTSVDLIPQGEGVAIPLRTKKLFTTFVAPPNRTDTVNQAPTAENYVYVSSEILKHNKGVDMDLESNMIAVNTRPDLVPVLTAT